MKHFILAIVMVASLASCTSSPKIPEIKLEPVKAEDILPMPDPALMQRSPVWERIKPGSSNGVALSVMTRNNMTAKELEWKTKNLQRFVCSLYKNPVWEICNK